MKSWFSRYFHSFSFIGLVFAVLFFSASVTPSLLPRNFFFQGLLSGFALATGYGVGVGFLNLYQFLEFPKPSKNLERTSKIITSIVVAVVFVVYLRQMTFWQNSIRELMEMPPLETAHPYTTAVIAVFSAGCLIAVVRWLGWMCRYASRQLNRFLPRRVATTLGVTMIGLLAIFIANGVIARGLMSAADSFFAKADALIDEGVAQPEIAIASGSSGSSIAWDTIGRRGKNFIVEGPQESDLTEFWGRACLQPVRVYVGLRSRDSLEARAKLALKELIRVDGFKRSTLIVGTPTGTGWLDPAAVDSVEYLLEGDTAIVSMQYSYLPSWLTIIVDPTRSIVASQALFDEIYDYWLTLPTDDRPKLYLFGLSLGAFGSEVSADLYKVFDDPIQGAVWSGPPFPSTQWQELTRERNEGSPAWLPRFRNGSMVRFTSQENTLESGKPWGGMRNVYVQYASDPMVFFSPDLAFQKPAWLEGQRGPDVSPHLKWYPVVTFLQIAFDLPMATSVPNGYGHNYSPSSYIDAWIAVTNSEAIPLEVVERLKKKMFIPPFYP